MKCNMTREEVIEVYHELLNQKIKEAFEVFAPELKENEDERIRKDVLAFIRREGQHIDKYKWHKWIAWLEKQKINTEGDFGRGYDCGYNACLNSHGAEFFEKQKEQKEIQMPNSTELIEMWDKEEAMLKEKDFRGDKWRLAYNAFLDGFARGTCVKSEKQKEQKPTDLVEEEYIENRNDGTYTFDTTKDGFDAFMDGFNKGYELGMKEQTKK